MATATQTDALIGVLMGDTRTALVATALPAVGLVEKRWVSG
jgi:hypothetical protein